MCRGSDVVGSRHPVQHACRKGSGNLRKDDNPIEWNDREGRGVASKVVGATQALSWMGCVQDFVRQVLQVSRSKGPIATNCRDRATSPYRTLAELVKLVLQAQLTLRSRAM